MNLPGRKRFIKVMSVMVFISLLAATLKRDWGYFTSQLVTAFVLWNYWDCIQETERKLREIQVKAKKAIEILERSKAAQREH